MRTYASSPFPRFLNTVAILAGFVMAADCSPFYSIGVRSTLAQALNVECILHTAQTTEGVQRVLIHQVKPKERNGVAKAVDDFIDPPTTYLVTMTDQRDAEIEQRPLKDGRAMLWVGREGFGIPPSHRTIETDQAFYVRLVSHIADMCKGQYSNGITCVPASEVCQKRLSRSPSAP
ncbi:MAG TPA: hypothetical protein VL261_06440 [Nitrospira sp.]|nr:hypothetical protein [Nitrospira sp.]